MKHPLKKIAAFGGGYRRISHLPPDLSYDKREGAGERCEEHIQMGRNKN